MQKAGSDCTQEFCTEYCKYRCGSNYTRKFCTGMGIYSSGRKGTGSFKVHPVESLLVDGKYMTGRK